MSKELEALERIRKARYFVDFELNANVGEDYKEELDIIETALKENIELKKCIDLIGDIETNNKKLKALEIIKEKKVYPSFLLNTKNLEEYNKEVIQKLTQEEYDLLKEVLL